LPFNAPPKTLPLLAYLLLHRNGPVPRQSLSFLFWPDETEETARANLRRHLHWLRQSLPAPAEGHPWLLNDAKSLQWNLEANYRLDVAEFERLSAWLSVIARTLDACQLKLLSRRRSVANQPADRRPSSNRSFSTKTGSNGSGVGDALTR